MHDSKAMLRRRRQKRRRNVRRLGHNSRGLNTQQDDYVSACTSELMTLTTTTNSSSSSPSAVSLQDQFAAFVFRYCCRDGSRNSGNYTISSGRAAGPACPKNPSTTTVISFADLPISIQIAFAGCRQENPSGCLDFLRSNEHNNNSSSSTSLNASTIPLLCEETYPRLVQGGYLVAKAAGVGGTVSPAPTPPRTPLPTGQMIDGQNTVATTKGPNTNDSARSGSPDTGSSAGNPPSQTKGTPSPPPSPTLEHTVEQVVSKNETTITSTNTTKSNSTTSTIGTTITTMTICSDTNSSCRTNVTTTGPQNSPGLPSLFNGTTKHNGSNSGNGPCDPDATPQQQLQPMQSRANSLPNAAITAIILAVTVAFFGLAFALFCRNRARSVVPAEHQDIVVLLSTDGGEDTIPDDPALVGDGSVASERSKEHGDEGEEQDANSTDDESRSTGSWLKASHANISVGNSSGNASSSSSSRGRSRSQTATNKQLSSFSGATAATRNKKTKSTRSHSLSAPRRRFEFPSQLDPIVRYNRSRSLTVSVSPREHISDNNPILRRRTRSSKSSLLFSFFSFEPTTNDVRRTDDDEMDVNTKSLSTTLPCTIPTAAARKRNPLEETTGKNSNNVKNTMEYRIMVPRKNAGSTVDKDFEEKQSNIRKNDLSIAAAS
jgi:hypothetical protein